MPTSRPEPPTLLPFPVSKPPVEAGHSFTRRVWKLNGRNPGSQSGASTAPLSWGSDRQILDVNVEKLPFARCHNRWVVTSEALPSVVQQTSVFWTSHNTVVGAKHFRHAVSASGE
jgi:hypothetical protein